MCYGSQCDNEIKSGPNTGECGGGICQPEVEVCDICGGLTINEDCVCDHCIEILEKEKVS
jgi:hypothetical protein